MRAALTQTLAILALLLVWPSSNARPTPALSTHTPSNQTLIGPEGLNLSDQAGLGVCEDPCLDADEETSLVDDTSCARHAPTVARVQLAASLETGSPWSGPALQGALIHVAPKQSPPAPALSA